LCESPHFPARPARQERRFGSRLFCVEQRTIQCLDAAASKAASGPDVRRARQSTPSTSESVNQKDNLIEINFFNSRRYSVLRGYLGDQRMKRRRRTWTAKDVRTLKKLANKRTQAGTIARTLKRTEGATRQKAFSLGLSLETRAAKL